MKETKFDQFHLSREITKALNLLTYNKPTKVQEQAIPKLLKKKDVIIKSQTGSGKTGAFAIPLCHLIDWDENKPQVLILTPTRELADQVKEEVFYIGRFKRIKAVAIYGKYPYHRQVKQLKEKTHVVVATPGRLLDHMDRGSIDTSMIQYLVIDEADEMLNMGFVEQVEDIMKELPKNRMTTVLSATMPEDIKRLCENYMKEPTLIEVEKEEVANKQITQVNYDVAREDKMQLLKDITKVKNPTRSIIFCNTQKQVEVVEEVLRQEEYSCNKIHGGMEQKDRLSIMKAFRQGEFRYLVATDVAARGIDISDISLVINYDVPRQCENYVHRIGRTGRHKSQGEAINFVTEEDQMYMEDIQDYTGVTIETGLKPKEEEVHKAMEAFTKTQIDCKKPEISKGQRLNNEILKLHINAGKKTKMRPVDIVGTLCSIEGMTAEDIGIINVLDVSTFVEILNNKGEMVYEALQTKTIKGRLRCVTKKED